MSALLYTLIPSFLAFFLQSGSFALSVSAWISAASGTRPIRYTMTNTRGKSKVTVPALKKRKTFVATSSSGTFAKARQSFLCFSQGL
ncbi:hypothetical protein V6Z12_D10G181800 [Gossypium hirsutum]